MSHRDDDDIDFPHLLGVLAVLVVWVRGAVRGIFGGSAR